MHIASPAHARSAGNSSVSVVRMVQLTPPSTDVAIDRLLMDAQNVVVPHSMAEMGIDACIGSVHVSPASSDAVTNVADDDRTSRPMHRVDVGHVTASVVGPSGTTLHVTPASVVRTSPL